MDDQERNIIQLTDEDGNDVEFEHLMTIEHENNYYIMLQALENSDDSGEGEALILKIAQDEKGEDVYVTIDDDEELDTVFEKFIEAMDEADTGDDEEDEEDDEEKGE